MASLVRTYKRLLHQKPLITNVLTTTTFMAAGDLTSQLIFQRDQALDLARTGRFAFAGFIFIGPVVRGCLVMIDRVFGPTNSLKTLAKKLVLDQAVIAPCFLAANLTLLNFLKLCDISEAKAEMQAKFMDMLKLNYSFWPFVQMVNFYFVPLTYRVLFGSGAAFAWNTILSHRLNQTQVGGIEQEKHTDKKR